MDKYRENKPGGFEKSVVGAKSNRYGNKINGKKLTKVKVFGLINLNISTKN